MINRTDTKAIKVGDIQIGKQNKVIIQSMTNTKTKDIEATVNQINRLVNAGCEVVRVAVLDEEDAQAILELKRRTNVPLVADIHFNYKLALIAAENGIDKIRINPGNIGDKENVVKVVDACKKRNIPIRIGINTGSIEQDLLDKYDGVTAQGMIESAQRHVDILEELDFYDICLSFKASDVRLTIDAYRLAAETFNYPLHLGVTEAGTVLSGSIKSSAALGVLLEEGIGDTIRISLSTDPVEEIKVCKKLLKCFDLYKNTPNLVACPTCGRIQYDMLPIVNEIEDFLNEIHADIDVAIMGCPVNGLQEASRADIGVAGGRENAILFKKGIKIRTVPQSEIVSALKEEIINHINKQES